MTIEGGKVDWLEMEESKKERKKERKKKAIERKKKRRKEKKATADLFHFFLLRAILRNHFLHPTRSREGIVPQSVLE
jgi:hypothetical protein